MVFTSVDPFDAFADASARLFLAVGLFLRGRQGEEEEAVPLRASHVVGDGTEGPADLTIEFKPVHEDLHDDSPALILALQIGSRRWEPRVESAGHLAADAQLGSSVASGPNLGYRRQSQLLDSQRNAAR